MAYPQLSGRMVRLNGINQRLAGYYPAPLSWNALFLRMSANPERFPVGTEYLMDFVTYGGCLLRVYTASGQHGWWLQTTTGSATISETITAGSDDKGPIHFVLAWDGSQVAVYVGNRRVYIGSLSGVFSGPTPYMSVGSRYEGPTTQPFQGDMGHIILHNAIPTPYAGLPENIYDGELTALEFLRVHGLTAADVLCLYDWRADDGTNYGYGGSGYDLSPVNFPTFLAGDFHYGWVDETTPTIEYPRATVLAARLLAARLRARVKQ